jgi:hypothetical protein
MSVDKRVFVVKELCATERSYCEVLQCMNDCFVGPLSGELSSAELAVLFPQLETLTNYSASLLKALEEKLSVWNSDRSTVGDVFVKLGPFLKTTAHFVSGHPHACAMAEQLSQTSAKFRAIAAAAQKDPRAKNNNLLALLIAPIQRVPRYVLLLNELLKHTPEGHPDHQLLVNALALLRQVADDVNEAKGRADNSRVLLATALLIKPAVDDLLEPHRLLLLDGVLTDVAQNKQFRFMLLSDLLLKLGVGKFAYGPHKGKFDLKAILSLNNARIATNRGGIDTFGVDFDDGVSLTLQFDDQKAKDEWLTTLRDAISQFSRRPIAYRGRPLLEPFEERAVSVLATPPVPPTVHLHTRIFALLSAHWPRLLSVLIGIVAAVAAYSMMMGSKTPAVPSSPSWYIRLLVPSSDSTTIVPSCMFVLFFVLLSTIFAAHV